MSHYDDMAFGGYVAGGFQQLPWWQPTEQEESTWTAVSALTTNWTIQDTVGEAAAAAAWSSETPLGNRNI